MNSDNTSEESHQTEEHARVICDALERNGLGVEGKVFPIKTEVIYENE